MPMNRACPECTQLDAWCLLRGEAGQGLSSQELPIIVEEAKHKPEGN